MSIDKKWLPRDVAEHEWCRRCGGQSVAWAAESPLWNFVMRGGSIDGTPIYDDLVCMTCFIALAQDAGVTEKWRLTTRTLPAGVEKVTPSGRRWDAQRWLWIDAGAVRNAARHWYLWVLLAVATCAWVATVSLATHAAETYNTAGYGALFVVAMLSGFALWPLSAWAAKKTWLESHQ